jgi:hypothetical protein
LVSETKGRTFESSRAHSKAAAKRLFLFALVQPVNFFLHIHEQQNVISRTTHEQVSPKITFSRATDAPLSKTCLKLSKHPGKAMARGFARQVLQQAGCPTNNAIRGKAILAKLVLILDRIETNLKEIR